MRPGSVNRVVHLELHTGDLPGARTFYAELCGWRSRRIDTPHGSYVALALGRQRQEQGRAPEREELGGGVVQCPVERPLWLPYVEVADIARAIDRARLLGAAVLLEPREGPTGWRSVIATRAGGEIALWQSKG
jgi:predicted enzyme related to lactoylglutathione lyase